MDGGMEMDGEDFDEQRFDAVPATESGEGPEYGWRVYMQTVMSIS